jgi:hypothetical protein
MAVKYLFGQTEEVALLLHWPVRPNFLGFFRRQEIEFALAHRE